MIFSTINFDILIPKLLNAHGLNRLISFQEGNRLSDRLHKYYYHSVVPCYKRVNIPLSFKATRVTYKADTIIILSGNADYVELVRHLKYEGVDVEIAVVEQITEAILVEEVGYFTAITREDCFKYKPLSENYDKSALLIFSCIVL
ncbi:NYN domain-containing protein [Catalinimonas niigatensis]|uniref:NYN domain-containing protein n=1 Tax=Catalinimonas niigatensis TaxID=1397264 RepID=UPI002666D55D|nr:NYN domain-containing protein [Catalinimonas niigatensis]WPP51635.1 NYN domain-containing protein [Catalinimonas niigatensis]